MPPAIVFIQKGYRQSFPGGYFYASIESAKRFSPESPLYVISDECPANMQGEQCHWLPLRDFADRAAAFRAVYKHMSTSGREGEQFCFERWFVLLALLHQLRLDQCLYLDSDIQLLCSSAEVERHFDQCQMTLSKGTSPHFSYIRSPAVVEDFCELVMSVYRGEADGIVREICADAAERGRRGAAVGITDMYFWDLLRQQKRWPAGEVTDIRNGLTFDHVIYSSDGFERVGDKLYRGQDVTDCKSLVFQKGVAHVRLKETGEMIRFGSLHFQGNCKMYAPYIAGIFEQSRSNPEIEFKLDHLLPLLEIFE